MGKGLPAARRFERGGSSQARLCAQYDALAEQIEALRDNEAFQQEDMAKAGVIVTLDHWGRLSIHRGMVRGEDRQSNDVGTGEGVENTEAEEGREGGKAES
ncbi:hypothetical protein [Brucella intermedia]|uniref:hypothetical protein n=1 Tax=Brucella intermedia TaxID=94625 RepID=UPI00124D87BF|nr:hypothetical protein [Brucella intermedia]KAB2724320.1 hypothetical protein F9L02_21145 [Brucella intermedia]